MVQIQFLVAHISAYHRQTGNSISVVVQLANEHLIDSNDCKDIDRPVRIQKYFGGKFLFYFKHRICYLSSSPTDQKWAGSRR